MNATNPLRRLAIVTLASVLVAAPALAERKLIKDENGIKVEEEAVAGRSLPILFGTTTMVASPARIAEWIQAVHTYTDCLLYTSPSPRDKRQNRMPSSA